MIVIERNPIAPAFAETNAAHYAGWFDEQHSSLYRPLNVPAQACPPMHPAWDPYDDFSG